MGSDAFDTSKSEMSRFFNGKKIPPVVILHTDTLHNLSLPSECLIFFLTCTALLLRLAMCIFSLVYRVYLYWNRSIT